MPRDCGFEFILILAEVFLPPQVAHRLVSVDAEVRPFHRHRHLAAIKQSCRLGTVFQIPSPDFPGVLKRNPATGLAQRVLVNLKQAEYCAAWRRLAAHWREWESTILVSSSGLDRGDKGFYDLGSAQWRQLAQLANEVRFPLLGASFFWCAGDGQDRTKS